MLSRYWEEVEKYNKNWGVLQDLKSWQKKKKSNDYKTIYGKFLEGTFHLGGRLKHNSVVSNRKFFVHYYLTQTIK